MHAMMNTARVVCRVLTFFTGRVVGGLRFILLSGSEVLSGDVCNQRSQAQAVKD